MNSVATSLGIYGDPHAEIPNLDTLGRSGTLFESGYYCRSHVVPRLGRFANVNGLGRTDQQQSFADSRIELITGLHTVPGLDDISEPPCSVRYGLLTPRAEGSLRTPAPSDVTAPFCQVVDDGSSR